MGGKNLARTYVTFNDIVHVCQGKKLYDQRFGEKNKLPIPPFPPQKTNGWPLMSAAVE